MSVATDAGPLPDLTGFQRDVLYVIADLGSPIGLDVKRDLEEHYDEREIHHGRLYPNLDTLVEKGLVSKQEADRRSNEYQLTTRGERDLRAHQQWTRDRLGGDN